MKDWLLGDEGVAFRSPFHQQTQVTFEVVESGSTSFSASGKRARRLDAAVSRGGALHASLRRFLFHVTPGDPPPDSRAKAVGWAFPALFNVPAAATTNEVFDD